MPALPARWRVEGSRGEEGRSMVERLSLVRMVGLAVEGVSLFVSGRGHWDVGRDWYRCCWGSISWIDAGQGGRASRLR